MSQKNNVHSNIGECAGNADTVSDAAAVLADAKEECKDTIARREEDFSDPVCINTNQIYDSCRDRDCVREQRVYLSEENQELIKKAINVKLKSAEVIWVFTDVSPISFNRGFFSVDLKFFVMTTLEVFTGVCNPEIITGLTTFDKRVILFGSNGSTKIFTSTVDLNDDDYIIETWQKKNMPAVTVEVAEPVALTAEIREAKCCDCDSGESSTASCVSVPEAISSIFNDELVVDDCARQVLVTYGLFFIVRLERDTQLLVDAVDFCIPTRECVSSAEDSPCDLFNDIRFPVDEFFPPQKSGDNSYDVKCQCKKKNCGCNK